LTQEHLRLISLPFLNGAEASRYGLLLVSWSEKYFKKFYLSSGMK